MTSCSVPNFSRSRLISGVRVTLSPISPSYTDMATGQPCASVIVDLQHAFAAVATVAELGKRAGGSAPKVARQQVVQHQGAAARLTRGELLLDGVLVCKQPVRGRVQIILVGIGHAEVFRPRSWCATSAWWRAFRVERGCAKPPSPTIVCFHGRPRRRPPKPSPDAPWLNQPLAPHHARGSR